MNHLFFDLWKNFVHIIFPNRCIHCQLSLLAEESELCLLCLALLKESELSGNHPYRSKLTGFLANLKVVSGYEFHKGNVIQSVLHDIKYKGNLKMAHLVGYQLYKKFQQELAGVEVVVPVPLHRVKMQSRGYNQAMELIKGFVLPKEVVVLDALTRDKNTATQTNKSRYDRWVNLEEVFVLKNKALLGKNVLLVDDVLTTGATLESCVTALLKGKPNSVVIMTLAVAV